MTGPGERPSGGPEDDFDAAAGQLSQRLATGLTDVLNSTFAALGFSYRQGAHGREVARQIRAKAEQRRPEAPTEDDLAEIVMGAFDTFGQGYDRAEVRAEVARQWRVAPKLGRTA